MAVFIGSPEYSVGVAKLSGFPVLRVDNWGRITVRYTGSGVSAIQGFLMY